jgi:hypothetical protein
VIASLERSHRRLARQGRATAIAIAKQPINGAWGIIAKRQVTKSRQPLAEVANQLAHVERVIDALKWVVDTLGDGAVVRECHPTTSSTRGPTSNDLIVDVAGIELRFEVSDVANGKDGNDKEAKDLKALGVNIRGEAGVSTFRRKFLVVSSLFGVRKPRMPRLRGAKWRYVAQRVPRTDTLILEIVGAEREGRRK